MSIANEITRLQNIKSDIRTALNDKGIDASSHNYADFAEDINNLELLDSLDDVAFGNNPEVDEYGKTASQYYEDIADAINFVNNRSNGVSLETLTVTENKTYIAPRGTAYDEILVNIPSQTEKDINFYDYDGMLLYSYTLAEIQALTELPAQPEHNGLVATGWNWTLEDLQIENRPVDVGAHYRTSDGCHKLYIAIEYDCQRNLMLSLYINGTIQIDWGDNSSPQTITEKGTPTITHEYASIGNYCIAIKVISGKISARSTYYPILNFAYKPSQLGSNQYAVSANRLIRKIEGGNDDIEGSWLNAFYQTDAETIVIPNNNWLGNNNALNLGLSRFLKFFSMPSGSTRGISFDYCRCLTHISFPKGLTNISAMIDSGVINLSLPSNMLVFGNQCFKQNKNLRKVTLPPNLTKISNSLFSECVALPTIDIPSSVTAIEASAFNDCRSLLYIKIPNSIQQIGNNAFNVCRNTVIYDFTEWTITNLDACSFGTGIFNSITSQTKILFKYKSVANYAATTTNFATYSGYFDFEEDDT